MTLFPDTDEEASERSGPASFYILTLTAGEWRRRTAGLTRSTAYAYIILAAGPRKAAHVWRHRGLEV